MSGRLTAVAPERLAPEPSEGAFLTVKELADWLGVSQASIRNWCDRGKLPHYRLENAIRFDPDEIEAWLRSRYRPTTSD